MEQILNIWILSNININNMIFDTCCREAQVVFTLSAVTTCVYAWQSSATCVYYTKDEGYVNQLWTKGNINILYKYN